MRDTGEGRLMRVMLRRMLWRSSSFDLFLSFSVFSLSR